MGTDPQQVSNAADAPPLQTVTPSGASASPPVTPSPTPPPTPPQQVAQLQPQQPPQPQQPTTVSNAPSSPVNHPSVQRAGILRSIAETLAGGPRYRESIDPVTGATTYQQVPLSRADIGMAIALEAVSGALSGLSVQGPNSAARAGALGFAQGQQQRQAFDLQQQQRAQQQFENESSALVRRAQIYEANSRAVLNTSEAEQQGADAIDKLVAINRQSGVLDVDPSTLDNGGVPMTQQEIMDAMKSGKISPTDAIGPVAGRVEITDPTTGFKRWEATHLVIRDPNQKVPLTQQTWDYFASQGVPGFPPGVKVGPSAQIKLSQLQIANETAGAHYLANRRLDDLRNILDGTPYAKVVPSGVDFTKPGVRTAMQRFQTYVSHNAANLADPFTSLLQMGADKRDPKTGVMQPNPDAKYVSTVADAFGGWAVLQAAHNELEAQKKTASDYAVVDTLDKADAILAAPKRFTPDKVQAAKTFIALSNQQGEAKAREAARARAVATGADVEAMYKYGRNPVTGEQLSLDNAPDSMLVNANGQVIPQNLVSTYKPSAQEKQTADTARQVLAISADLQKELQSNPALAGPLSGRSKQAIAKLGYGDKQAQKFLDDLTFLASASTKMHTGRFSNEILRKMDNLIKPGMNGDQFTGALSSINDVASRYADEDKLTTVGDYKRQQQTPMNPTTATGRQVQIPAGAQIGRDAKGNIVGYRLNGKYYPLGGQQ